MKRLEILRFVLFAVLLLVVIFEFMMLLNPPILPEHNLPILLEDYLNELADYTATLNSLRIADKVLTVALFGAIVFPED